MVKDLEANNNNISLIMINNTDVKQELDHGKNNKRRNKSKVNSIIKNINNKSSSQIKLKSNNNNDKTTNKNNLIESELNVLKFQEAIKKDKRSCFEFYFSLIKTRHLLISIFFSNTGYNITEIKICLFFFTFALDFVFNSLFFTDETMHKIYEDEGIFNFIYNLPIILYSTIISGIISFIIKKLALSEESIFEIKNEKKDKIKTKVEKVKKNLVIKFVIFFIISFILLFSFWIYIGCFCSVYINTQIYLFKDTVISFSLSLIIPFVKNFIPCILRYIALKEQGIIYKLSQLLQ
jgi:hypothetical protein